MSAAPVRSGRAIVAAAGTSGALLGMLPGMFLMSVLRDPLPTLAVGPILFLNSAILGGATSLAVSNYGVRKRDRGLIGDVMLVSISTAAILAALWVVLIWSGWWVRAFPFAPYNGLLGSGIVVGAAASFATLALREPYAPDVYDLAFILAWTMLPPGLILGLMTVGCSNGYCV